MGQVCTYVCVYVHMYVHMHVNFYFRDAIFALEQYFTSGEEFLEHIVLRLRKQIVASTQKSKHVLKYLSANGSRFQAVKDVSLLFSW